ncbi:MAG: LptA/OstA family protein [Pseudomonadota bacterium]
MTFRPAALIAAAVLVLISALSVSGQAKVAFGGLKADTTLPVEVNAENFAVDTATGNAVFTGNVRVAQGEMRMAAGEVRIIYAPDGNAIQSMIASGGVTLTNAAEAAEATEALYTIDSGVVVMTGNVLLTQGGSTMSAEKLTIDLKSGTGQLEGGVRTTFVPAAKN